MTRYDEFPFPGLPSVQELTDASNECRHGNLPLDKDVDCTCWNLSWRPGRPTVVVLTLPERVCLCGCGAPVRAGRRFVSGHNARAHMRVRRAA